MLSIGVLKVVTFQVVLAYNVHRSFILIYYGSIAETGQPWQVSELLVLTQCAYEKKMSKNMQYNLKKLLTFLFALIYLCN